MQAKARKRFVLDFNGFWFDSQSEKEVETRKARLLKVKLENVNKLMDVLDLPRGKGDKAAKVDAILSFLMEPKVMSEVNLAVKDAAKKEKAKRRRERKVRQRGEPKKRKTAESIPEKKTIQYQEEEEEVENEPCHQVGLFINLSFSCDTNICSVLLRRPGCFADFLPRFTSQRQSYSGS